MARLLDLRHLGTPGVIAAYLLPGPEPALVDCGPATCLEALLAGLREAGLEPADLRHVLITHIHPDHAGAAGALVRLNPALRVHVHELGAPHLADPARLEESARRLYGADFDRMFGPIEPVPEENLAVLGDRVLDLEAFPTPGHAPHHAAFLGPDGACYAGDAAGLLMPPGRFLYPAAAPPGIDLDAWSRSLGAIEARGPAVLRLAHFGEVADPPAHLARMRERLSQWTGWIRAGRSAEEFARAAGEQLLAEGGDPVRYGQQPGFDLSYAGLARAVEKQRQREGGG